MKLEHKSSNDWLRLHTFYLCSELGVNYSQLEQ